MKKSLPVFNIKSKAEIFKEVAQVTGHRNFEFFMASLYTAISA